MKLLPGEYWCVVLRFRHRVWHWHWPKWDIVNCEKTKVN